MKKVLWIIFLSYCLSAACYLKTNNCCQKKLTLKKQSDGLEITPEYLNASPHTPSPAQILVPDQKGGLFACRRRSVLLLKENLIYTDYIYLPDSPCSLDPQTLELTGIISLKILQRGPDFFDDFLGHLLRHPPDEARYIRYLDSQEIWEKPSADSTSAPLLYCLHRFALYKELDHDDPEQHRHWAQK